MRRKKTPQGTFYQGVNTLPPSCLQNNTKRTLSESFSEESVNKRNRVEGPVKDLEECFFNSMRDRVEELVKQTKTQDKTKELKNKLLNVKTLLAAIITNAAQLAKCDRKNGRSSYLKTNKIAEAAVGSVVKDTAKGYSSATPTNKQPYEEMRTCTVQMNSLFRSDLSPIVKTFVCIRLQDTMVRASSAEDKEKGLSFIFKVNLIELLGGQTLAKSLNLICSEDALRQMLNDRKEASVEHRLVVQDLNIVEEQQDFLEEEGTLDDDVPERRLNQPKSIIKHLVFSNDTPVYLEDFLPPKKQYHVIAYQMYFCIFANDVLKYALYTKFTRALCPSRSFSSSSALHLDSVALYQLLTQNIDQEKSEEPSLHTNQQEKKGYSRMILYGYNRDELIGSQEKVRQNKDAIFNAVFDIGEIQKACESYGLSFAHRITCLPGMKTVRLLGSRIKTHGSVTEETDQSYEARILRNPNVIQEGQKTKDVLFSELQSLTEVKALESVCKIELDLLKDSNFQRKIKECKSNWGTTDDKDQLYRTIEKYKESRYKSYLTVNKIRNELAEKRQQLYFRQMKIRFKSKLYNVKDVPQDSRGQIEKCGKGVTKVEDRTVVNPGDFNYAGTDNGLVNMPTSIPMSLQRMRFHLKLFNYYTALSKDSNEDKRKKYTDEGEKVQLIEDSMRELESAPVASNDMAIGKFRAKYDQRQSLRDFYNSPKIINKKRHVEIQQYRYRHLLCRRERLELKHSERTGAGSRVKGFGKYGGKWKQNIHGEAVNVCITNECKTSRTCIFCFSPLTNPRIPGKKKRSYKVNKGTFLCINPRCITVNNRCASKPRDGLSALAIALVGLSSVIFGAAPPPFYNVSQITAEHYTKITSDFCTRRDDFAATL
ncbi:hypothetical protein PHYBLDRAFT_168162 [Phycomyces blakesleeanus NRRL 1555(-)]|uniref:Uncharacterized protein n=1 Tax=Phycomyces blakesleeanus (strain ATCC 8743b / DSM 1359 / FGSC 10004 / NBRC 33097 / NRRL 1555) TaxID=763407 RepID=A0A162NF08_PHYB8|nr:hypothetical protein PHYBLDRAFT_168162 [Phycomyces blakesleeanus NRRL 1555(-)]OAD73728.1 hypothetical protein PHYBLDRAFT_168162 [Phycomyces blakesleeanus NRRL 1555(-)]|eukprot:XP_018291768.1 hypothetical protein PHYBLDRAFT_168162 [Phycomyces blakesleeanus NRRL 1555(-)]